MRDQGKVVIWSGEHGAYWRDGGRGYTNDVKEAGVWDREDAVRIAQGCGPEKDILLIPWYRQPTPINPVSDLRRVVEATLLWFDHRVWDDDMRGKWRELTGRDEATTKDLCDFARQVLAKTEVA